MAISFNTGTSTTRTAVAHTVQPTLAIPAGVLAGDVMLAGVSMFTFTPTGPGITLTPAVGSWAQVGTLLNSGPSGGLNLFGAVWTRTATGADAGTTLTFAFTGTQGSTDQFWWAISLGAYTGAGGVDVFNTAAGTSGEATAAVSTGAANDWAVFFGAEGVSSAGTVTAGPAGGGTIRENPNTAGVTGVLCDGNASVGPAGTSIGGGSFTATNPISWFADFTIGVAPSSAAPAVGPPAVPLHGPRRARIYWPGT